MSFFFVNKNLRLNNLKNRTAMNVKISVFGICIKVITYLLHCSKGDQIRREILNGKLHFVILSNYSVICMNVP